MAVTVREYSMVGLESNGIDSVDNGDDTYTVKFPQQTKQGLMLLWVPLPYTWAVPAAASGVTVVNQTAMTWGAYTSLLYGKYVTDLNRHDAFTVTGGGTPLTPLAYWFMVLNGAAIDPALITKNVTVTAGTNVINCPTLTSNTDGKQPFRFGANRNTAASSITAPAGTTEVMQDVAGGGNRFTLGVSKDDATYDDTEIAAAKTFATQCGGLDGHGITFMVPPGPVISDGPTGGPSLPTNQYRSAANFLIPQFAYGI